MFIFSISFTAFQGCKHDPISTEEVCFDTQVEPIIIANCAYSGCHDAVSRREGVDLSNYEKIISTGEVNAGNANKSELYKVLKAKGEKRMPPSGKLNDEEIQVIYDWIEQGAENLICDTNDCDTVTSSFANDVLPITDVYCKNCHGATNGSGGISLTDYSNISAAAENGSLTGSINGTNGFQKMPQGSTLTDCQIAIIEKWVKEGALDN